MMRRITLSLASLVLVSTLLAQPAAAQTGRGALGGAAGARLLADWPAAAVGLPSALWSGQEPAHLLRVKVGGVTVVITGGTATAIIMAVAADGIASQTKIAVICSDLARLKNVSTLSVANLQRAPPIPHNQ